MSSSVLVSHPTGNANVRGALDGFRRRGILESFHTSVACCKDDWLYRLGVGPLRDFRRRMYGDAVRGKVHTYPWTELGRMASTKLGLRAWTRHETGRFCIDRVYRDLDTRVARYVARHPGRMDAVYTYEDCALETFKAAKSMGKCCLYDLTAAYWKGVRQLLDTERTANADWSMTLGGFKDSSEKLMRKDRELALADKIYVASSFVRDTLRLCEGVTAEIEVIPYGFPDVNLRREYLPFRNRKIRMLFVGSLSQQKGLSYLFEAVRGLEKYVELTVVGKGNIEECPVLKMALDGVDYIPSLPHDGILRLMAEKDVLIFPSLCDGFGLVVTEAMSQGTPVVTTERTCGPDIVKSGQNGWIVQAGKTAPLRDLFMEFIERPDVLQEVGREAMRTASCRPWSRYGAELSASVRNFLNERGFCRS